MRHSVLLTLFCFLTLSSICQTKTNSSPFDIGDLERLFCMPKISFAQNFMLTRGYKFIKSSGEGMYYEFEPSNTKQNTLIRFECVKESIWKIQIHTSDVDMINKLQASTGFYGYELATNIYPAPKQGEYWWYKNVKIIGKNLYFSLQSTETSDSSKYKVHAYFFIEQRNS